MFQLSETHDMLRDTCRDFADKELAPKAGAIDKSHEYPQDQVRQLAELGLMSVAIEEAWEAVGLIICLTRSPWKKYPVGVPPPVW